MQLIERWWNGSWGRLGRRDLWLRTDGVEWQIEARRGGADNEIDVIVRLYDGEEEARAALARVVGGEGTRWCQLPVQREWLRP